MRMPRLLLVILALGLCLIWTFPQPAAAADEWMPLDPADLALKTSTVEKDADAEAIFWQVRVTDEVDREYGTMQTVLKHYIRIKIFTDRGREAQSKIDIPYGTDEEIKDIAARTIKPDGTIVELKKADVFDRTIIKTSGAKIKAKSFAMPGIETGSVIEYRWLELRKKTLTFSAVFKLQRDIPIRLVKYYLRAADLTWYDPNLRMKMRSFHADITPLVDEKDHYSSTTLSNVPAFREEPRMPPEDELRAWLLIYYSSSNYKSAEELYADKGRERYEVWKSALKVSDEIKKATAEAIGDASAPDDKLHRLFDFVRSKIRNVYDDAGGLTPDERAKMKQNKTATDVLKRGMGDGSDINALFAAMANAAGFESRITRVSDRGFWFFDSKSFDDFKLVTSHVAVKVGDDWRFFDPASKYVPYGMLRWQEEDQPSLIPDPRTPIFVKTPMSPPNKSKQIRRATLNLGEDGTLEGDVRIEYTGHFAAAKKEDLDEESTVQREDSVKEEIKERMSTAEVTEIKLENVTEPEKPLVLSYHIKVPGYAQRTGKRIFIQPAFFVHGESPVFNTTDRKYPVYFSYPWTEDDEVNINLPQGYALDNADAPSPIDAGGISEYRPYMGVTKDGKQLIAKRTFFFGGKNVLLIPINAYGQVKSLFDAINKSDNHTITLKQATTAAGSN